MSQLKPARNSLQFFAQFCQQRSALAEVPLYAYRCTDTEFAELRVLLRRLLKDKRPADYNTSQAALFCLYAAEWWHRSFEGGARSWEGILASIEVNPLSALQAFYDVIDRGLAVWGRKLRVQGGRRMYLLTLALEGGFPLHLIRQEGSPLRRFFRALLADFRSLSAAGLPASQIALRAAHHLPPSYRREQIFELAGETVAQIWKLQAQVQGEPDPIAALNQKVPGWPLQLPLTLDDELARELFTGLVREASAAAAPMSAQLFIYTELVRIGKQLQLRRRLVLPEFLTPAQLAGALGIEGSAPDRFYLDIGHAEGERLTVAMMTRITDASDELRYVIEPLGGVRALTAWTAQVQVIAYADWTQLGTLVPPGGGALDELPWVFAHSTDSSSPAGGEGATFRLLGEGAVKSQRAALYVALPARATLQPATGAELTVVGQLHEPARPLYELRGSATVSTVDATYRLRSGASADTEVQYWLNGETLFGNNPAAPVYVGIPALVQRRGGGSLRLVPPRELSYQLRPANGGWRPLDDLCVGEVLLRHQEDGEVRFQRHLRLVPKGAEARLLLQGDTGTIELRGLGTPQLALREPADVPHEILYEATPDTFRIQLQRTTSAPPQRLTLDVLWPAGPRLQLQFPYPSTGIHFLTASGEPWPETRPTPLDRLGMLSLQVVSPVPIRVLVLGRLQEPGSHSLAEQTGTQVVLASARIVQDAPRLLIPLAPLVDRITGLLAMTTSLDARVELCVELQGAGQLSRAQMSVLRFAGKVGKAPGAEPHDEILRCCLWGPDNTPLPEAEQQSAQMFAISLQESERRLPLSYVDGIFQINRALLRPGIWILGAFDGELCRWRPVCVRCVAREEAEIAPGSADAAASPTTQVAGPPSLQFHKLDALCAELARDAAHPQWELVLTSCRLLSRFPACVLPVLRALLGHQEAIAATALTIDSEFGAFFLGMESLPFSFSCLPLVAWLRAAATQVNYLRGQLSIHLPAAQREALLARQLAGLCEHAPRWLRGLGPVGDLVREQVLRQPLRQGSELQVARDPKTRELLARRLWEDCQELLRRHSEDLWPAGRRIEEALARCGAKFPAAQLRTLFAPLESLARDEQVHYRRPVLLAPLVAALCCVVGDRLSDSELFTLRIMQRFDPVWFDAAYENLLTCLMATLDPLSIHRMMKRPGESEPA